MILYGEFSKQEEIDTQYDPERGVPDFGIYARFFVKESTGVRQDLKSTLDVRFGLDITQAIRHAFSGIGRGCEGVR